MSELSQRLFPGGSSVSEEDNSKIQIVKKLLRLCCHLCIALGVLKRHV